MEISIAVALMWFRLFKWMRFWPELGYYTRLLTMTMWDIRYFSLLLIMVIFTSSNILFILNDQQLLIENTSLYEDFVDNSIFNALIS